MLLESWLLYVMVTIAVAATPGPGNLAIVVQTMNYGLISSIPIICGITIGLFLLAVIAITGLSATIVASEQLFIIIQYVGAGYVMFLGLKMIVSKIDYNIPKETRRLEKGKLFRQGIMLSVPNPKAILFFSALFPLFIDPGGDVTIQLMILLFTHFILSTMVLFSYALVTGKISPFLKNYNRSVNRVIGSIFVAVAIYLMLQGYF